MTKIGTTPRRLPALSRRQRVRLDGRREAVLRGARRVRGRRGRLRRHRRHVLLVGAGQLRRRVGDDPRPVDGRAGQPDRIVVATKVGKLARPDRPLGEDDPRGRRELAPPARHRPHRPLLRPRRRPGDAARGDPGAFDALVREGKVRHLAASNYTEPRLAEALTVSKRGGLARFVALQPHYNLVHRSEYEGSLAGLCVREGLACFPYYALASGFLAGKYRAGVRVASARSGERRSTSTRGASRPRRARRDRRGARKRPSPPSPSPGSSRVPPSPRRSPAPARRSSSPSCFPPSRWASPTDERPAWTTPRRRPPGGRRQASWRETSEACVPPPPMSGTISSSSAVAPCRSKV